MQKINTFLDLVITQGGSDLHLVAGNPPRIRLHGIAYTVKYRELRGEDVYKLVYDLIPPENLEEFQNKGSTDFAYQLDDRARFRSSTGHQLERVHQLRCKRKARPAKC